MKIWLTDQDIKPVVLRGEILTVRIVVREVIERDKNLYKLIQAIWNSIKKIIPIINVNQ